MIDETIRETALILSNIALGTATALAIAGWAVARRSLQRALKREANLRRKAKRAYRGRFEGAR